ASSPSGWPASRRPPRRRRRPSRCGRRWSSSSSPRGAAVSRNHSRPGAVVKENHPAAETADVHQVELEENVVREGPRAASYQDGREEQMALVDQGRPKACAASSGPPTVMSRSAPAFIWRTTAGSNSRSILVLALETASSVRE